MASLTLLAFNGDFQSPEFLGEEERTLVSDYLRALLPELSSLLLALYPLW